LLANLREFASGAIQFLLLPGKVPGFRDLARGDDLEAGPELHIGLLFDTSGSMAGEKMDAARAAIGRFVNELLDRNDELFLYRFSNSPVLVQGWTLAPAARFLRIALPRADPAPRRVELDLPGQLEQELVGYHVQANNPYLRRKIVPPWAKLMLVVRDEEVFTATEAGPIRQGDHVYFLAPPEKAEALDRFFVEMPPPVAPDPRLLGDFFVSGDVTLGALAEIYGIEVAVEDRGTSLAEHFTEQLGHPPEEGEALPLGAIELVAFKVADGNVRVVGLRLIDTEETPDAGDWFARLRSRIRDMLRRA